MPLETASSDGVAIPNTAIHVVAGSGIARPVSLASPLPSSKPNNAAFGTVVSVPTVGGSTVAAGRSIGIVVTAAGNVSMQLSGGGTLVWPVNVGGNILPFAVTAINTSGTTATATYANLN